MKDLDLIDNAEQLIAPKKDKQKQSLITFAKLNKYFIFPFLCPIFCTISNYFYVHADKSKVTNNIFICITIFYQLPYIVGGLIYFVSYFKQKKIKINENNKEKSDKEIEYIYNEKTIKINTKKILLLILLISILFLFNEFFGYLYIKQNMLIIRLYYIFFIPIFSKFILKENIYKHQYLSYIISIIGIILIIIASYLDFESEDKLSNIFKIVKGCIYSLIFVLIKYLNEIYYISPFKTSLLFGIIALLLISLFFIIYSLIKYQDLSYFNDCFDFSKVEDKAKVIIYFILAFIFDTCLKIFVLLSLIYFSPILLLITNILIPILSWIEELIEKGQSMPTVIIYPIGYTIILFATLMYNEIIILNFCGLNKNTKKFVEQRQNKESIELIKYRNGSFNHNNTLMTEDETINSDD